MNTLVLRLRENVRKGGVSGSRRSAVWLSEILILTWPVLSWIIDIVWQRDTGGILTRVLNSSARENEILEMQTYHSYWVLVEYTISTICGDFINKKQFKNYNFHITNFQIVISKLFIGRSYDCKVYDYCSYNCHNWGSKEDTVTPGQIFLLYNIKILGPFGWCYVFWQQGEDIRNK